MKLIKVTDPLTLSFCHPQILYTPSVQNFDSLTVHRSKLFSYNSAQPKHLI